ncbi:MAG TPA: guanylate kinase [Vicinamibacterales bacterium]|jgi:guanylate kinase|nr:guanylate kinase [Vicinamibacterales bacterium]
MSGRLFIVSAPSGTGKTTLVERLVRDMQGISMSRSYTSRPPRPGEADGVDYNFISRERFEAMIANGDLLEHAEVFGNWYGTGAAETRRTLAGGGDVVLVIDVQGARKVRNASFEHVGIFVLPPSFEILEDRLRRRSKDSEVQIQRRLAVAQQEVAAVAEYEYVVINDDVDNAVARLRSIVEAERSRLRAMQPQADAIIESFRAAPRRV